MTIELKDEQERELVAAIKRYFLAERDEEIGDLQASLLLGFILKEIGPSVYNQAVRDAQAQVQRAVADLDIALHKPELGYTTEQRTARNKGRA